MQALGSDGFSTSKRSRVETICVPNEYHACARKAFWPENGSKNGLRGQFRCERRTLAYRISQHMLPVPVIGV